MEAFKESYAGLSDAELMEPGVTGAWSVRDIIAHVSWWEEEALTHLPHILDGGRKATAVFRKYGGIDAFNAQQAELKRGTCLSPRYYGSGTTPTAGSSTSSRVRRKINFFGKPASVIAYGLIHTAITRCTPRRYGNGESNGQPNKGRSEPMRSATWIKKKLCDFCHRGWRL